MTRLQDLLRQRLHGVKRILYRGDRPHWIAKALNAFWDANTAAAAGWPAPGTCVWKWWVGPVAG